MWILAAAVLSTGALQGDERLEQRFALDVHGRRLELFDAHASALRARPGFDCDGKKRAFDGALSQMGWYAASATDRAVLAVLDSAVEAPGWEIVFLASTDGGCHWRIASRLRKPDYQLVVKSLAVSKARVCVTLEDDETPRRYQSCSSDGGRSWSRFAQR
jgi:hypothetical protein